MLHKYHTSLMRGFQRLACVAYVVCGWAISAHASNNVSLAWDENSEANIAGYRVHYGTASSTYTNTIDVGKALTASIANLTTGTTYFFAVTAYDTNSLESLPSEEISFTPKSSEPRTGTFTGALIASNGGVTAMMTLVLTKGAAFSGELMVGNSTKPIRGAFGTDGNVAVRVVIPGQAPWTVTLQLSDDGKSMSANLANAGTTLPFALSRVPYSKSQPAQEAGKFTGLFERALPIPEGGLPAENIQLTGWGWATITVTNLGAVRLIARLADNAAVTLSSTLNSDGTFLSHTRLYAGQGSFSGEIAIRETPSISDGDGVLLWFKPPQKGSGLYAAGIKTTVPIQLSKLRVASGTMAAPILRLPALATISEGEIPQSNPIQRQLSVESGMKLKVMNPGSDRLRLTLTPNTGLLSGSFIHPLDNRPRTLSGVVFAKTGVAAGFFIGRKTTGAVAITGLAPF